MLLLSERTLLQGKWTGGGRAARITSVSVPCPPPLLEKSCAYGGKASNLRTFDRALQPAKPGNREQVRGGEQARNRYQQDQKQRAAG